MEVVLMRKIYIVDDWDWTSSDGAGCWGCFIVLIIIGSIFRFARNLLAQIGFFDLLRRLGYYDIFAGTGTFGEVVRPMVLIAVPVAAYYAVVFIVRHGFHVPSILAGCAVGLLCCLLFGINVMIAFIFGVAVTYSCYKFFDKKM